MKHNRVVEAVIEIPAGSINKYEIMKEKKKIKLDRVLPTSLGYPAEYGYIENTLSEDGDPLDILVLSSTRTFPGCIVDAKIIGYLDMIDDGQRDEKVIAVMADDPRLSEYNSINDLAKHIRKEIKHFFKHYKDMNEVCKVEVLEYHDFEEASDLYRKALFMNSGC
jgi:inorganic pyrophosphatase